MIKRMWSACFRIGWKKPESGWTKREPAEDTLGHIPRGAAD
jgi:hypothetical protein